MTDHPVKRSRENRVDGPWRFNGLSGDALRAVTDMTQLGERSIWIDCDVIQADGGTRTASITGAFIALADALTMSEDTRSD